jgi:hypothetical protein
VLVEDKRGMLSGWKAEEVDAVKAMAAYIDLNPVRAGLVREAGEYAWSGYGEACRGKRRAQRGLCRVLGIGVDAWAGQQVAGRYLGLLVGVDWETGRRRSGDRRDELDRINKIDRIGDEGGVDDMDRINKIDRIRDEDGVSELDTINKIDRIEDRSGVGVMDRIGDGKNAFGGAGEREGHDRMDEDDRIADGVTGRSLKELVRGRVGEFSEGLVMGSQAFVDEVFQANRSFFGAKRKEGARRLASTAIPFFVARRSGKSESIGGKAGAEAGDPG